jgi:hypothetical protein
VGPLDLGMRASQMDGDLTVDLVGGSDAGLTEDLDLIEDLDSDSVVDSAAGDAALVLAGVGDGGGIRGGGAGVILPTRTGE